jgi:hypothetical protein
MARKKIPVPDTPFQADLKKCGVGKGKDCCAYLMVTPGGSECGRADPMMKEVIEKRVRNGHMIAARLPDKEFPKCQG